MPNKRTNNNFAILIINLISSEQFLIDGKGKVSNQFDTWTEHHWSSNALLGHFTHQPD